MEHFGDGGRFGVNITYSMEKTPMGTAGALKNAEHLLDETIMTLYGDSYLFLDLDDIESSFARSGKSSLMTVYRNYGRYDRSNTLVRDGQVVSYSKQHTEGMDYIDYGLNVFRKQVLDLIPPDRPYQMEDLFSELVRKNQMAAYEVKERFYEIGSPSGLAEFQRYLEGACK